MLEGFPTVELGTSCTGDWLFILCTRDPHCINYRFSPFGVSKAKDKYLGCRTNSSVFNFSTYLNTLLCEE